MTDANDKVVAVLGSSGVVAPYLQQRLRVAGYGGVIVSRSQVEAGDGFDWVDTQRLRTGDWTLPDGATVLALWPVSMVGEEFAVLAAAKRIVALSSTSILNRGASSDPVDRGIAARLAAGETAIERNCGRSGVEYTILRPSLIYDGVTDHSVTEIARLISRLGFFVIAGRGTGLRQPVHAEDVAEAMVRSIANPATRNRTFNLTGGETLSYRGMVERIFAGMNRPARIVSVPRLALKLAAYAMNTVGYLRHRPNVADRMELDLAYASDDTVEALGFRPRSFHPEIVIDI